MRFLVLAFVLFIYCQISHSRVLVQRDGQTAVTALLEDKNTIKLRGDGMDKAIDYRTGEMVLGIPGDNSAAITMVSNYGFWGCLISEDTQDDMIHRRSGSISAHIDMPVYEEFFKEVGCYNKMEAQVEKWLQLSDVGGPPLAIPAAPILSSWQRKRFSNSPDGRVPKHEPFITQAAKDIRKKLEKYIRDDQTLHIPFLGGPMGRSTHAIVIRQKAIKTPIGQLNPTVEILGTGLDYVRGGEVPVGTFAMSGTWQHIFQKDECDGAMKWMWSKEEVGNLDGFNVIAFESIRDTSDYSDLVEAENAFISNISHD